MWSVRTAEGEKMQSDNTTDDSVQLCTCKEKKMSKMEMCAKLLRKPQGVTAANC